MALGAGCRVALLLPPPPLLLTFPAATTPLAAVLYEKARETRRAAEAETV